MSVGILDREVTGKGGAAEFFRAICTVAIGIVPLDAVVCQQEMHGSVEKS